MPFPGPKMKTKPAQSASRAPLTARTPLTLRLIEVIRAIPKGKVAAYGQLAALAGSPRGARQVARLLHALSEKEKLPWHRVIDRNGRISLALDGGGARQAALLRKEKVEVSPAGTIRMDRFQWRP